MGLEELVSLIWLLPIPKGPWRRRKENYSDPVRDRHAQINAGEAQGFMSLLSPDQSIKVH